MSNNEFEKLRKVVDLQESICLYLPGSNAKLKYDLDNYPHRLFNDLIVLYRVELGHSGDSLSFVVVSNELAAILDMSEEDLFNLAKQNSSRMHPASVRSFNSVVQSLLEDMSKEDEISDDLDSTNNILVVTNELGINGSTSMISDELLFLELATKCGKDLLVIPSSVHELLVMPLEPDCNIEEMNQMVRNVNITQVSPEERLADHVFIYDRNARKFIAA